MHARTKAQTGRGAAVPALLVIAGAVVRIFGAWCYRDTLNADKVLKRSL